jgi:hypothetical protein
MKRSLLILIIALLLVVMFSTAPVTALKVEGAKIMLDVKPGTTYIFPMAVSIKPDDSVSEYAIDILGFSQSLDAGMYQGLSPEKDINELSARTFISFPSSSIRLQPGERKEFNATINVPQDVGDGGRYAVILIHPATAGTGQASFATAVLVPVMLTVERTNLVETGEITGITVGDVIAGKPITVATTLKNTGNHHYYGAINHVSVKDSSGQEVGSTKSDPFVRAVIPGQSVRFDTPLITGLPVGTYSVVSRMTLENGQLLDEESITFAVNEEYIPPFVESTMNVVPDRETVLVTPEKEIVITFPVGAVLSDVKVTVSPYSQELHVLPTGTMAGTIVFTVEGLTGLLAKPATLVVKYNPADLQAAGGDAGKLALARYDRTDSQWTILPTMVDTNAGTLTTTTDRFSTWAVIAVHDGGASASKPSRPFLPGPDPLLICGFVALVLLVKGMR